MPSKLDLKRQVEEAKEIWDRISIDVAWASHHYFEQEEAPPGTKDELRRNLMEALRTWRNARERYEHAVEACELEEAITNPGFRR